MGGTADAGQCGLAEVRFTLDPADTEAEITDVEWYALDYYDDALGGADALNTSCTPAPSTVEGIALTADAQWLLVFGGTAGPDVGLAALYATNDNGGVCAINIGADATDPATYTFTSPISGTLHGNVATAMGAPDDGVPLYVRYPAEQAITRDIVPTDTSALLPHPHVEGLYFAGTWTNSKCSLCTSDRLPLGFYVLQRRTWPDTFAPVWSFVRRTTSSLMYRHIMSMEWGSADADDHLDDIYLGTAAGGMWEAELSW